MRPPEFTGGNPRACKVLRNSLSGASMRPPEFTGGNTTGSPTLPVRVARCFNEAAGIHRRKPHLRGVGVANTQHPASMRPPEFTGGNPGAAGALPFARYLHASMRPPEFTGGNIIWQERKAPRFVSLQ